MQVAFFQDILFVCSDICNNTLRISLQVNKVITSLKEIAADINEINFSTNTSHSLALMSRFFLFHVVLFYYCYCYTHNHCSFYYYFYNVITLP